MLFPKKISAVFAAERGRLLGPLSGELERRAGPANAAGHGCVTQPGGGKT